MFKRVIFLIFAVFAICSCSEIDKEHRGSGYLVLFVSHNTTLKSGIELTDFILRISEGQTEIINERIGNLPEPIDLPVGIYAVEVYSMEFSEPKFEQPFYYGKTIVEIEQNVTKNAVLVCSQGNAGIRVVWSKDFSDLYSTFQAKIFSDDGYLNYSSTETRTGYFLPGNVSVVIMADGLTIDGGIITLEARDLVTAYLRPKYTASGNLNIDISIDKTVNEREVEIVIDPENIIEEQNSVTNPYTIAQAIAHQGSNDVWIIGYIVGSKPSANYDFVDGAWLNTNIVLADDIDQSDDRNCIFVDLATAGFRNPLNLVNNPLNLHRKLLIKGNLRAYHLRAGLRDLSDFSFVEQ